jgi:hypothetical protein
MPSSPCAFGNLSYLKVLELISCSWEPSRHFSGAVARERRAIGKLFGKQTLLFLLFIICFIMDFLGH